MTGAAVQMRAPALRRLADWPTRLADLVAAVQHAPLVWGTHDCCTFAADAVLACTGTDPLADLRGRWASRAEAGELLQQLGGLRHAVCARLGAPLPAHAYARRGDVVLLALGNANALGVCTGAWAVGPGEQGLQRVAMSATAGDTRPLAAWRI